MIKVKELREARGLEQKQLAADIGVSQPTISDWENGRKVPSAKSTQKLADYFDVTTDYLLGRTDNPVPPNEKKPLVNEDPELTEYLEELANRSEMRMLFKLAKDATKADVEAAVKIIEALRGVNRDDVDS